MSVLSYDLFHFLSKSCYGVKLTAFSFYSSFYYNYIFLRITIFCIILYITYCIYYIVIIILLLYFFILLYIITNIIIIIKIIFIIYIFDKFITMKFKKYFSFNLIWNINFFYYYFPDCLDYIYYIFKINHYYFKKFNFKLSFAIFSFWINFKFNIMILIIYIIILRNYL
jgi:hypothetical protein